MNPVPLVVRHQVAVGGRVVDSASGRPIAGARVRISAKGVAVRREANSNASGLFYFLDLPDGAYELEADLPGGGTRRGRARQRVKVSRDTDGNVRPLFADLPLSATTVHGTVFAAAGKERIAMAEVRMKGSGERTLTDAEGRYWLRGVESGNRTVGVSAQGFKPVSEAILVGKPGSEQSVDFPLARLKDG